MKRRREPLAVNFSELASLYGLKIADIQELFKQFVSQGGSSKRGSADTLLAYMTWMSNNYISTKK